MENILSKLSVNIGLPTNADKIRQQLSDCLANVDDVYSYLIYADYIQGALSSFTVEFLVSQNSYYNTINHAYLLNDISNTICNTAEQDKRYVVGYKQPPLDRLLQAYEPLVHSLARQQKTYWKQLEYEDLCQMCRLVICTLYKAGYYVHKNLIRRAFTNEVLMSIRKDKYKPVIVSLDKKVGNGEDNDILIKDIIPDVQQEERSQDEEDYEYLQTVLREQRELVIEHLGQRTYDRLLQEYGNRNTTTWGQKVTFRLREWLRKEGITERTFWRNT